MQREFVVASLTVLLGQQVTWFAANWNSRIRNYLVSLNTLIFYT